MYLKSKERNMRMSFYSILMDGFLMCISPTSYLHLSQRPALPSVDIVSAAPREAHIEDVGVFEWR